MTIDHTSLYTVKDRLDEIKDFYLAALEPFGYSIFADWPKICVVGFGNKATEGDNFEHADFWIMGLAEAPNHTTHLAFGTKDRKIVDAFHAAALKAGAKCNGPPGPRPNYCPNYYAAFVLDPMGNNIEAVCREAE